MNEEAMSPQDQLAAARHLPADLMLVKMEGEHIMTMAAAKQWDVAKLINEAKALLEANPAAAQEAVYSKPVGMRPDRCKKCGNERKRKQWEKFHPHCPACKTNGQNANMVAGRMQFARGLSIRAMESLASLFGYNRVATTADPVTDGVYRVTAVFVDYGRGIIRSDQDLVSQWRKDRASGRMQKQDEERFLEMTVKAAKAKVRRNAIRDGLPFELRQAYEAKASEIAPKFLDAAKVAEIIENFADYGVTLADLQVLVGKTKTEGWKAGELETLRGVWVALQNGEMTVDELLGELRNPAAADEPEDPGDAPALEATAGKGRKGKGSKAAEAVADELTGGAAEETPASDAASGQDEPEAPVASEQSAEPPAAPRAATGSKGGASKGSGKGSKSAEAGGDAKTPPASTDHKAQKRDAAPAEQGRSEPAAAPAKAPAPAKPPVAPGPPKMTPEGAAQYIRLRYPDDCETFDVEGIAKRAVGQANPVGYMDLILTRKNANWANFLKRESAAEDAEPEQPAEGGPGWVGSDAPAGQVVGGPVAPADDEQRPNSLTKPLPRPASMSDVAAHMEKTIGNHKSATRLRKLIETHIRNNEGLTNDEAAYLCDLADGRAWLIENGQADAGQGSLLPAE
jgi:predicted Zn-ribbon and HTH transcriptional regulator